MQTVKAFPINLVYDSNKSKWNKRPAIPKGTDWHTYEATEKELNHAKNIGIIIPEKIVVIDVDTHKGVTTRDIDKALNCKLNWDAAELQQTPSGGMHYAFALPNNVIVRQGSDLLGVTGFDTRTSGNGWIASGENYADLTMTGLPTALCDEAWPMLDDAAIYALQSRQDIDQDDDLMSLVASQPINDINIDDIKVYLNALPDNEVNSYDNWLKVGMALYHQFTGEKQGLKLWANWSRASSDYNEDELRAKWRSFAKSHTNNPVTFAHVIYRAGGHKSLHKQKMLSLEDKALQVCDKSSYLALKDEVANTGRNVLTDDLRAMLADTVAKTAGKELGLNKTEIKKAFSVKKQNFSDNDDTVNCADWANNWVYIEKLCEFANTELNYNIKREAFNAKFDREMECIIAEKSAATLALNDYKIPTVVDTMYWPSADRIFEYEKKNMLNAFFESGCEPAQDIDDDGQAVIDMFMQHIRFTLSDEREQCILLDWLAFVVQNKGQRINWALLLQGSQGTGKSYFVKVLQLILGEHVRNLDPTAIAGRFTGWAHGSLVVAVEEIRISGTNKYEVLDRMKPFITNDTVQIEEKGRDHRTVPNFTNYLLLTNHKDAIPVVDGDRRYCVLFSRVQSEQQLFSELGSEKAASDYFANLFDETKRRPDAISRFLLDRKISKEFNPQGRAPETNARKKMMSMSLSPERLAIEDAIAQHRCSVINERILDITYLTELMLMDGDELPKTRTLSTILLEMGYESIDKRRLKITSKNRYHYVWFCAPDDDIENIKNIVRDFHECGF